jgi:hypothetical protein
VLLIAIELAHVQRQRQLRCERTGGGVVGQVMAKRRSPTVIHMRDSSSWLPVRHPRRLRRAARRRINPRHNPTQDTLNRLLKPFRLRLSLAPLAGKPRRSAA